MGDTNIEWTNVTWNPVRGCSRVSEGCRNCYAERIAGRFSGRGHGFSGFATLVTKDGLTAPAYHGITGAARLGFRARWTGKVALVLNKLDEPLHWRKPRRVFVNSMSDLFHESLPEQVIDEVFAVMLAAPQHTFQVLTKRPGRMRRYMDAGFVPGGVLVAHDGLVLNSPVADPQTWPPRNVWLGVSVENQETADERIPLLLQTPAAKRFVSYEPALGPVTFNGPRTPWLEVPAAAPGAPGAKLGGTKLDWIIVGGESGPGARPFDVAWARSTIEQCKAAGVAAFVKQLGAKPFDQTRTWDSPTPGFNMHLKSSKGGDPGEWPTDLRVRQFPT